MASNVFPMLSSSPPPIDDCPDDDDDDDEFGNFTSANIPFDSSFDSPVAGEKFKSFKPGDNGVNDANFSDEIHKFNSFSNSNTPSPQEFVPNFTDDSEHCKNGFTPIKANNCKISGSDLDISSGEDSVCHNKIEVTSHKPVSLKSESVLPSSNNCESLTSESCDSQQNAALNNSVINKPDEEVLQDIPSEPNSFEVPLVCDSSDDKVVKLNHNFCDDGNRLSVTCDEHKAFIPDPVTDSEFSKDISDLDKISLKDEINLSTDKFDCDFKSESSENDPEEYEDFQKTKNLFASNHAHSSSLELSDCKFPVAPESTSDMISKSDLECQTVSEKFHEFSDNEFDEFQSCGEKTTVIENTESISKSNEEFDDFQDFQYSSVSNVEADDFADFQDFSAADASNTDDFADFSAVPFDSNKPSQHSEPGEFADFEEASFGTSSESFQISSTQKSADPLSTVINAIFPLSDSLHDSDTSDESSPNILEQTNKSRRLWEKLHEVEQTPGLRFQWGVSHSFQQLLRSVNVDYHSILRTSSVPIFASGLSLLEPVKGLSSLANHESEDRNQIPKDPIPPVEFDWNSSGLINPLDSGQAVSTLMDLSFLSSVETDSNATCNDHSFENELLKPSPTLLCPENNSKTQILEQLLSKNVSSLPNSKITHRPSDLSEEAIRVLDQLPDLSFMKAKVLMFPISSKT